MSHESWQNFCSIATLHVSIIWEICFHIKFSIWKLGYQTELLQIPPIFENLYWKILYHVLVWWPNVFVGLSVLKRTFKSWWEPNLNAQNSKLFVFNNKFKKKLKCFFVLQTVFDCTLFCHVRAILLFRIVIHLFWPVKCQIID